MAFIGKNPKLNTTTHVPQSADPANPTEGMIQYADGTARAEGLWVYKNSNWTQVIDSEGELNFFDQGNLESIQASEFATGNNATFDGGGTLQGVFSISTTAADLIRGRQTGKLILHATPGTSDDDYIATPVIDIPQGYRGQNLVMKGRYNYDGATDDIKVVVKDQTNTATLTTGGELLGAFSNAENTSKEFFISFFCPSNCDQIKIGFQVVTHATGSEVFKFDDLIVTPNGLTQIKTLSSETISHSAVTVLDGVGEIRFNTANLASVGDDLLTIEDDVANTRTKFIAKVPCSVDVDFNAVLTTGNRAVEIYLNGASINTGSRTTAATVNSFVSSSRQLAVGDFITLASNDTLVSSPVQLNITALAQGDQAASLTTAVSQRNRIRRSNGTSSAATLLQFGTSDISEGTSITYATGVFTVHESGFYSISSSLKMGSALNVGIFRNLTSFTAASVDCLAKAQHGSAVPEEMAVPYEYFDAGDEIRWISDVNHTFSTGTESHVQISKAQVADLVGVPLPAVAYIKDVKTSATTGGSFTSGSYQTRTLNTLEGDSGVATLASNQFTLTSGTYDIECRAPGFAVDGHKAKVRNITDSTDDIIGASASADASGVQTDSMVIGRLTLTSNKTFEIQHRCDTTNANGFGEAQGYGDSEIYTVVKITKIR